MSKFWGGGGCQKPTNQSQHMGRSMLRRNQIAATIIYCNVLLLQLELQYFNSLQQGTPPCGNTAATLSLWPNMTTFYPDPEDAVKPWNCQVKLPGFRKLEIGNKTCDPTGPTKPVDSMAQNYHQNPRSRERNLQQMRAQVIFCLVWDFRSRPFSLFLGSFLGAKRARFFNPFRSVNPTGKLPKSLEIGKGLVWFQPVSARNSAFFWHPKNWNLTPLSANSEPVGNQSGKSVHRPKRHKNAANLALFAGFLPKIDQKSAKSLQKPAFLCLLGRCTDFPDWFPIPDWFPTGSEFAESGAEICRKRCQILARNLPNWMIS